MSFSVSAEAEDFEYSSGGVARPARPAVEPRPAALPARWSPTTCASTARRAPLLADADDERSLRAFLDDEGFSPLVRRPPARAPGRRRVVGRPRADVVVPGALPRRSSSPTTGCSRSPGARSGRRSRAARRATSRRSPPPSPTASASRTPVVAVTRHPTHVDVVADGEAAEEFDEVVIAAHADQALALLTDPSAAEAEVLGAFPYQPNEAVLHTDRALLPRRRAAWAAWNYHLPRRAARPLRRDLLHEPPAVPRRRPAVLRDAQPHGRDRARARHPRHPLRASRLHARGDGRPAPPRGDQRRAAHALLRRLLALGLPRGRRGQRARGASRACASGCPRERALRGLGRPPAPAARSSTASATASSWPTSTSTRSPSASARPGCGRRRTRRSCASGAPTTSATPTIPLADAVRALVAERTGTRPGGPVRLLTNLRCLGHLFNPVSFYYCFDRAGEGLRGRRRRGHEHAVGRAPRLRPGRARRGRRRARARRQGLPRLALHGHGPRVRAVPDPAGTPPGRGDRQPQGRRGPLRRDAASSSARRSTRRACGACCAASRRRRSRSWRASTPTRCG